LILESRSGDLRMASGKTKRSKLSFNLKRFAGFMKLFLRNKRAALGLLIIFGFAFLAIAAPILTPFNNLGQDPTFTGYVAGKYAAPIWLKQLPTWLGGNPAVSENMEILTDPSVPKLLPEGQLNYTETKSNFTNVYFDSNVNYPFSVPGLEFLNKNGSLAVSFHRESGTSAARDARVTLFTEFDYPWGGIPGITLGNLELLVNGTRRFEWRPTEQWYLIKVENTNKTSPKLVTLSITSSSRQGIYVAVTTDVTKYFGTNKEAGPARAEGGTPYYWRQQGYHNFTEWINGTDTLPYHWSDMNWSMSEGSLTNLTYDQMSASIDPRYLPMYADSGNVTYYTFMNDTRIADPDLKVRGNGPDIVQQLNWTATSTSLKYDCLGGATKIFATSTVGFSTRDSIIIGGIDNNETNAIQSLNTTENSFTLFTPLMASHGAAELVSKETQELTLFDKLLVKEKSAVWALVGFMLTDDEALYSVQALSSSGYPQILGSGTSWPYTTSSSQPNSGWQVIGQTMTVAKRIEYLNVPVKVRVFLGTVDQPMENMKTLFPIMGRVPIGFNRTTMGIDRPLSGKQYNDHWILSRASQNNYMSYIQVELVNDKYVLDNMECWPLTPGRYRFGVEITFTDRASSADDVSTTVYVDDLALKILGTSYGILGTDQYGQDLFSQLIYGSRISLYIGITVAVMSVTIGVAVGLVSGYMGGAVDQALMRFNDLLLVLPGLPLLIVLVAVLGARIENLILLLGLLGWNGFARVVRSQVLSLKERPFIEAAKAAGAGTGHIIVRHILPNVMALVYVSLATSVPGAITAEAALAWLGFFDPTRMSWGRMLHEVFVAGATRSWWWILPPGLCIALIATAFILLGYALDEVLNPKLRMRR